MFTIEKSFTGDLAHRIHNQNLDSNFTENGNKVLKCRRFHGHTFELKVKLGSEKLIDDMVLDYNEIGFVKNMIDDIMDHRTLISTTDPLFEKVLIPTFIKYSKGGKFEYVKWGANDYKVKRFDLSSVNDPDITEFLSSFTILDFTTSSENISKWIFNVIKNKIDNYNYNNSTTVKVISVSYKETPKSEAIYSE